MLTSPSDWPLWRKIIFRFTAIYLVLYCINFFGLAQLPLINTVYGIYTAAEKVVVEWLNQSLFHIKDALVPIAGSGDTSFGYAELCFHSLMAVVGTALWSLLDRKRPSYETAYYWLIVGLRYYVSMVSFVYGIIKVYAQQMPFPNLSQFATPLGDLSPMRLAWFFIGYSQPYEVFSGVMECVAGALLIFRRTSTLGALVAAGVFLNVAMMNLAYNIPVKLFSMHLFVFSCILLFTDAQRLLRFFVLNQPTEPLPPAYVFSQKWMQTSRILLKVAFIGLFIVFPFYSSYQSSLYPFNYSPPKEVLTTGVFDVASFETSGRMAADSLRWKDVIFEKNNSGSIQTTDTLFRIRYGRAYFGYKLDSLHQTISFKKRSSDSAHLFILQCTLPDTNTLILKGKVQNDSLKVVLKRKNKTFPLAKKPFDWMLETVP